MCSPCNGLFTLIIYHRIAESPHSGRYCILCRDAARRRDSFASRTWRIRLYSYPRLLLCLAETCKTINVSRDHVDFDVDAVGDLKFAQRGDLERVRNDIDVEIPAVDFVDGEAHAVDADGTLRRHEAHQGYGQLELNP